jgi:uncharacterized protein
MSGLTDKYSRLAALRPTRAMVSRPAAALRAPDADDPLATLLGAGLAKNRFGEHLAVRNWYSTPEFTEPSVVALDLLSRLRDTTLTRKTRVAMEDPQKWLFLDTETTGLAGGTGTYAFLIGIAWWDAGGLQVEQFFMRDFSEEHSVLHELAQRIAERPVLFTFNGKTFDWPLLENRFTMTRSIAVPKLAAHLDLLHPARALWRLRLGSVRLVELERLVLDATRMGWRREDDVVSALIPQFYFDYLRGGVAEPLAAVVRHNQMDLRGLAALFGKINELLAEGDGTLSDADGLDLFGLSRFLRKRGERDRAHSACAQALQAGLPAEFRPKARRELAAMAKRRGDHTRAAELWNEIVSDPENGVHACEQLAMHHERQTKDYARAIQFAELALAQARRCRLTCRDAYLTAKLARVEQKCLHRLTRLRHRIKPQRGALADRPLALQLNEAEPLA